MEGALLFIHSLIRFENLYIALKRILAV